MPMASLLFMWTYKEVLMNKQGLIKLTDNQIALLKATASENLDVAMAAQRALADEDN